MLLVHRGQMRRRTTSGDPFFRDEAHQCSPSSQHFLVSVLQETDQYQGSLPAGVHQSCSIHEIGFSLQSQSFQIFSTPVYSVRPHSL